MAQPFRGDDRVRRLRLHKTSIDPGRRAWATRIVQRLRARADWLLGSTVDDRAKDELIEQLLSDVLSGNTSISRQLFEDDEAFEAQLRVLLTVRSQELMGGPMS